MIKQMDQKQLTPRQDAIYRYIVEQNSQGIMPSIHEIGDQFAIRSYNGVLAHLIALEAKGWITREPNKARSIRAVGVVEEKFIEVEAGKTWISKSGSMRVECTAVVNGRVKLLVSRSM